jgi:hypothetical protein
MPGCALGHFNGCSARATGLLFDHALDGILFDRDT